MRGPSLGAESTKSSVSTGSGVSLSQRMRHTTIASTESAGGFVRSVCTGFAGARAARNIAAQSPESVGNAAQRSRFCPVRSLKVPPRDLLRSSCRKTITALDATH